MIGSTWYTVPLGSAEAFLEALVQILSDDPEMTAALDELVVAYLPD